MALAAATNKHEVDHRYPRFAVLFTNYSPEREQPLKTELRVASFVQNLDALADDWLAANIKRGWVAASSFRRPEEDAVEDRGHATPTKSSPEITRGPGEQSSGSRDDRRGGGRDRHRSPPLRRHTLPTDRSAHDRRDTAVPSSRARWLMALSLRAGWPQRGKMMTR